MENSQAAKKSRWTHKRIDLIALTFLLITGILLMPVKVSQKEAEEAEPITATAAAITLGKFLVVAIATWLIERGLDAVTKDKLDDNAGVNHSHWGRCNRGQRLGQRRILDRQLLHRNPQERGSRSAMQTP